MAPSMAARCWRRRGDGFLSIEFINRFVQNFESDQSSRPVYCEGQRFHKEEPHGDDQDHGLSRFQADAFTLYLKTHNFHWNVTGSMFNSLHTMFETQYTEQWAALDDVAERIRALGFNAPGSYREFAALTSIAEEPGLTDSADWREMVRQLVVANEAVCRTAREVLDVAAKGDDAPTEDLMTQRLQTHEKYAWMLRSLLQ